MSNSKVICPLCWDSRDPDPSSSSQICGLCQQMIGRCHMRSFDKVVAHYRELMRSPNIRPKMKEYIQFRTLDVVKSANANLEAGV